MTDYQVMWQKKQYLYTLKGCSNVSLPTKCWLNNQEEEKKNQIRKGKARNLAIIETQS